MLTLIKNALIFEFHNLIQITWKKKIYKSPQITLSS